MACARLRVISKCFSKFIWKIKLINRVMGGNIFVENFGLSVKLDTEENYNYENTFI